MTAPQAAREQMAREWLRKTGFYIHGNNVTEDRVASLVALIASTEQRVLEEAAEHWKRVGVIRSELYDKLESKAMTETGKIRNEETANFVAWLYQQAQERTP